MTSDPNLAALSFAAVAVGFVHCLCGPDHYVPFVAMARAGVWSLRKTLLVTLMCGIGHVASSALLGLVGVALGLIVSQLKAAEHVRGDLAGWLLFAFGTAYLLGGLVHARRVTSGPDTDDPATVDAGSVKPGTTARLAPWILFLVFLFGPCEPLIPLMMYLTAETSIWSVIWVTTLFGLTTLLTMTVLVALIYQGANLIRLHPSVRFGHALAGLAITLCGVAVLAGY